MFCGFHKTTSKGSECARGWCVLQCGLEAPCCGFGGELLQQPLNRLAQSIFQRRRVKIHLWRRGPSNRLFTCSASIGSASSSRRSRPFGANSATSAIGFGRGTPRSPRKCGSVPRDARESYGTWFRPPEWNREYGAIPSADRRETRTSRSNWRSRTHDRARAPSRECPRWKDVRDPFGHSHIGFAIFRTPYPQLHVVIAQCKAHSTKHADSHVISDNT